MSGVISRLQFQKRTSDRVNVYLDGDFAFGLPALTAAELRVGQHLTDAEIVALQALDAEQKAYDRAVRFLSYRPRSVAEVRRNLAKAKIEADVIETAIERLIDNSYLDDAEFARYWVENREQFRPKGARALRYELRQKGLDEQLIAAALADLNPVEAAYRAAQGRALRWTDLALVDFRRKLRGFLLRRGFDYDTVREVVDRLAEEIMSEKELAGQE